MRKMWAANHVPTGIDTDSQSICPCLTLANPTSTPQRCPESSAADPENSAAFVTSAS